MQDELGNGKTEFVGKELIYLNATVSAVPGNRTTLCVAQYSPTGTPTRHWLTYDWPLTASGTWRFGPFYAQPLEPEGIDAWRIWLNDRTTGHRDDYLTRWNYLAKTEEPKPEEPEKPGEPAAPTDISTSISVALSSTGVKVNNTITVFGTVNPANSGNMAMEQSKGRVTWFPIAWGVGTGVVIGQLTPTEAGSYIVRAKHTGYLDSAANKQYLASESGPVMVEVSKGFNWGVVIGGGVALRRWRNCVALAVKEDQVQARLT